MTNSYEQESTQDLPIGDLCLMPLRGTKEFTSNMDENIKYWRKKMSSTIQSEVLTFS